MAPGFGMSMASIDFLEHHLDIQEQLFVQVGKNHSQTLNLLEVTKPYLYAYLFIIGIIYLSKFFVLTLNRFLK